MVVNGPPLCSKRPPTTDTGTDVRILKNIGEGPATGVTTEMSATQMPGFQTRVTQNCSRRTMARLFSAVLQNHHTMDEWSLLIQYPEAQKRRKKIGGRSSEMGKRWRRQQTQMHVHLMDQTESF